MRATLLVFAMSFFGLNSAQSQDIRQCTMDSMSLYCGNLIDEVVADYEDMKKSVGGVKEYEDLLYSIRAGIESKLSTNSGESSAVSENLKLSIRNDANILSSEFKKYRRSGADIVGHPIFGVFEQCMLKAPKAKLQDFVRGFQARCK